MNQFGMNVWPWEYLLSLSKICCLWGFFMEMGKGFGVLQRPWRGKQLFYSIYSAGNTDLTGLHWKGAHCITIMGQASRGYPNDRVPLQNVVRFPIFSMRKLSPFWNEWFLPCSVSLQIQSVRPSVIISILEVRGNRFSTETCSTSFKASG